MSTQSLAVELELLSTSPDINTISAAVRDTEVVQALPVAALEAVCTLLFDRGRLSDCARVIRHLETRAGFSHFHDSVDRIAGFVRISENGIPVLAKQPNRAGRSGVVASFHFAAAPYVVSGYAQRSHQIMKGLHAATNWRPVICTRPGFPHDLRGVNVNTNEMSTLQDGLIYHHLKSPQSFRRDIYKYIAGAATSIDRFIMECDPSVVHAASSYANAAPCLIAARRRGLPFVYEMRGFWEETHADRDPDWAGTEQYLLERALETELAMCADAVVTISEAMRADLISRGVPEGRIYLAPNGVEPEALAPSRTREAVLTSVGLDPEKPTIGYIGSMVAYEGLDVLLQAVAALRVEGIHCNVLLVGDGRARATLEAQAAALGLRDCTVFTGKLSHSEAIDHYAAIDVCPFLRRSSRLCELVPPMKPLEAMALGKLVIASRVAPLAEIVKDGETGLLVDANDLAAVQDVLARALEPNADWRDLIQGAKSFVANERRWSLAAKQLAAAFDAVALKPQYSNHAKAGPGQVIRLLRSKAGDDTPSLASEVTTDGPAKRLIASLSGAGRSEQSEVDYVTSGGSVECSDGVRARTLTGVRLVRSPGVELEFTSDRVAVDHIGPSIEVDGDGGDIYEVEFSLLPPLVRARLYFCVELETASGARSITARIPVPLVAGRQRVSFVLPGMAKGARALLVTEERLSDPLWVASAARLRPLAPRSGAWSDTFWSRSGCAGSAGNMLSRELGTAEFKVEANRRYALSTRLSHPTKQRGELVWRVSFDDLHGQALSHASGLSYSDILQGLFRYVGAETATPDIEFTAPHGVTSARVSLLPFKGQHALDAEIVSPLRVIDLSAAKLRVALNPRPGSRTVLVYADLDPNLTDGSTVWLLSVLERMADVDGVDVYWLSRTPLAENPLHARVRAAENIHIIDPVVALGGSGPISSDMAVETILELDAEIGGFDRILVRGFKACKALTQSHRLAHSLAIYLTDISQTEDDLSDAARCELDIIFSTCAKAFVQTPELLEHLSKALPNCRAKFDLLQPWAPATDTAATADYTPIGRTRPPQLNPDQFNIVYAGKIAADWGILELLREFANVRKSRTDVALTVIGSKIHHGDLDGRFAQLFFDALSKCSGVTWLKGVPRNELLRWLPEFDLGWAWRSPKMEHSTRELSTKLVEYGAARLPAIVTRSPINSSYLGENYPLFADQSEHVGGLIQQILEDRDAGCSGGGILDVARDQIAASAERHLGLADHSTFVDRLFSGAPCKQDGLPTVLFAGHDFKFADPLISRLRTRGYNVLIDQWTGHAQHDPGKSAALLERADVVVCEWLLGNAHWYASRVRPSQRLICRLHAMELATGHVDGEELGRVDAFVTVSPQYKDLLLQRRADFTGRVHVISNGVDMAWYDASSRHVRRDRFALGLVGYVPQLKRFDRALDIVEALREKDERFRLKVKGRSPAEYKWMRNRSDELSYYRRCLSRITHTPSLVNGVSIDGHGADLRDFYYGLGHILSTSDQESFHLAVAEGAASGCHPTILAWQGSLDLYPKDWCVDSLEAAVERIYALTLNGRNGDADQVEMDDNGPRNFIAQNYAVDKVVDDWIDLLESVLGGNVVQRKT